MPVTDQTPVDSSTGNGVTTVFPYTFKILDEADILVTVDGVTKILMTDYSVSGVGNDAGGNVTFVAAPANGTTVVRTRDMGYERTTDYQDNGDLPASTLDDDIDRTVMLIQQLRAALLRSVKLPVGTTVEQVLTESAAARADKIMGFDSSGNIVVKAAVDIDVTPVSVFMASVLDDTTWQEALNTLGFKKGADITAAATTDLGTATGNTVDVTHSTGTTAITSLGGASLQAGTEIETRFVISDGTLTLTHHATNLYLAGGANITLANGDVIRWRKMHSSNAEWKMVGGWRADGSSWAVPPSQAEAEAGTATTPRPWTAERVAQAIAALGASGSATLGTVVDTSTGATSYTVTGLPSGVKKIAFAYGGISTNGTASVQIRVGPSGGVVNSGYAGAVYDGTSATLKTDGFYVDNFGAAAAVRHGRATLQLIDAATNTWSWESSVLSSDSNRAMRSGAGTISLAGALERFQIIANGTDTFDAGKLNILYWT
ncbi:MAG: hypothetical protein AMXMBFR76_25330 [Pseudomonadota bacterium]